MNEWFGPGAGENRPEGKTFYPVLGTWLLGSLPKNKLEEPVGNVRMQDYSRARVG